MPTRAAEVQLASLSYPAYPIMRSVIAFSDMEPDTPVSASPNPKAKGNLGMGKILAGAALIGSQLIRQPGFGFYTSSTYPTHSYQLPTNSAQAVGYNFIAAVVYICGLILIVMGLRRRRT